ncbi:condensation domain-containing protein [Streptomyces lavendulae]|uniref:condensation domain-containing protein n=1 Tax=Streptomyces lavendulae TaxID=1914 RepID=UPI0036960FFF
MAELNAAAQEYGAALSADPASAHEPFPLTDVQAAYLLGRSEGLRRGVPARSAGRPALRRSGGRVTETDESLLPPVAVDLLICDYSSIRLPLAELGRLCTGEVPSDPPDATFRDHVLAAGRVREGDRYRRDRDYWWSRIDGLPAAPDLPLRPDAPSAPPRFTRHGLRLTPAQWETLTRRSTEAGVTASGVLLQAFSETVGRWSRHPRFTLSLTVQNRLPLHPDTESVIGDFSSTSLLAVDPHGRRATRRPHAHRTGPSLGGHGTPALLGHRGAAGAGPPTRARRGPAAGHLHQHRRRRLRRGREEPPGRRSRWPTSTPPPWSGATSSCTPRSSSRRSARPTGAP